jgi:phospholipid/cholesterol/gamma-HCH transport system permease protein
MRPAAPAPYATGCTMRITEQIDALESMAVNPTQFILPRLVAGMAIRPSDSHLHRRHGRRLFRGGLYLASPRFVYNAENLLEPVDVVQVVRGDLPKEY